jgi:hypothetical protein
MKKKKVGEKKHIKTESRVILANAGRLASVEFSTDFIQILA